MHRERHTIGRVGWLRAAVLGANDGIVSTASLVLGVASANTSSSGVLLAGCAGLVAGAMSMATGEYVSVSSQADTEKAALAQEKKNWLPITKARSQNWRRYIYRGALSLPWPAPSQNSLWHRTHWTRTPVKNWGSQKQMQHSRFRPRYFPHSAFLLAQCYR